MLDLARTQPLAIRFQGDVLAYTHNRARADFGVPTVFKILTGGPLSNHLSYYAYFLLAERGNIGGLEDAWVLVHDVPLAGLSIQVGQFQLMDVTFPRELRLARQDYLIYTTPLSRSGFRLTYQRGVNVGYEVGPFDWLTGIVNGNGLASAHRDKLGHVIFDNDLPKVGYAHMGFDWKPFRLGFFGLYGAEGRANLVNRFWRAGPDLRIESGP